MWLLHSSASWNLFARKYALTGLALLSRKSFNIFNYLHHRLNTQGRRKKNEELCEIPKLENSVANTKLGGKQSQGGSQKRPRRPGFVCEFLLLFINRKAQKETTFANQASLTWKIIFLEHFPIAKWFQRFQPRALLAGFSKLTANLAYEHTCKYLRRENESQCYVWHVVFARYKLT